MFPLLLADIKPQLPLAVGGSIIIAGLFLAAFFVLGGIRLVRKRRGTKALGVLLLLALATRSYADIPPPKPKGIPTPMEITMSPEAAGGPVLQVPKGVVRAEGPGGIETIVAGLFFSGFLALGAVWMVRLGAETLKTAMKVAAVVVTVGSTLFLAGAVFAQRETYLTAGDLGSAVGQNDTRSGVVAVQIVPGDKARLLLPPPRRRRGPPRD